MRKLFFVIPLIFGLYINTYSQYITLRERQFYDETGQPFYPVMCNYMLDITYPPGVLSDLYLTPIAGYGLTSDHDYGPAVSDNMTQILNDFNQINVAQ